MYSMYDVTIVQIELAFVSSQGTGWGGGGGGGNPSHPIAEAERKSIKHLKVLHPEC